MSTDVQPVTIQGQAIQPTHVSAPHSFSAHDFFNVVRDVVSSGVIYHTEDAVKAALDAINEYEGHVVPPSDANVVKSETDAAPLEDVTQRRPSNAPPIPAPSSGAPQIDYTQLARALVQAGAFAQQEEGSPSPEESDGK